MHDDRETLSQRLTAAAIPYMGTVEQAQELANNIACFLPDEDFLEERIAASIRRRLSPEYRAINPAVQCSDVVCCAADIARAFRRWHLLRTWDGSLVGARGLIAAGKRGPAFGSLDFTITAAAH